MNFKEWLLESNLQIQDIPQFLLEMIKRNGGKWTLIQHRKLKPTYKYQTYGVCEFSAQDVRQSGDKFYFKTFYFVKKKLNMEPPEGYFGGPKWWGPSDSPERYQKEKEHGQPFEKVTEFDPDIGHRFLTFRGFIEGWKPGMMPGRELDYKTSAQIKGYPIPVSNPGDFRHDTIRIDDFDGLTTPAEVAGFVKTAIDKFYDSGWDNNDNDQFSDNPSPKPLAKSNV